MMANNLYALRDIEPHISALDDNPTLDTELHLTAILHSLQPLNEQDCTQSGRTLSEDSAHMRHDARTLFQVVNSAMHSRLTYLSKEEGPLYDISWMSWGEPRKDILRGAEKSFSGLLDKLAMVRLPDSRNTVLSPQQHAFDGYYTFDIDLTRANNLEVEATLDKLRRLSLIHI